MSQHRDGARGDSRLRIAPWRGDTTTAYLTPARGRVTAAVLERLVVDLVDDGFRTALTPALAAPEQEPFLAAGFAVHERLHLLVRGLDDLPVLAALDDRLRRGRRADRPRLLAVDAAAFPPFWQLDDAALDDALAATPSSRLRVSEDRAGTGDGERLNGYAVTGRAGPRGYLQRLAVDPVSRRHGLGSALVVDGLRWLRRWGAREVLVNTQEENGPALALYEALGFRRRAEGLAVLRRPLEPVR
jgi:ribosomal protein S18 acetylase RimI-like enzyme